MEATESIDLVGHGRFLTRGSSEGMDTSESAVARIPKQTVCDKKQAEAHSQAQIELSLTSDALDDPTASGRSLGVVGPTVKITESPAQNLLADSVTVLKKLTYKNWGKFSSWY